MKIFEGIIVSVGMNKTAVVELSRKTPHPLYKKLIKRSKKFKADTTGFEPVVGSLVKIVETRPISKDKYFKILSVSGVKALKKTIEPTEELDSSIKIKKPATTEGTASNAASRSLAETPFDVTQGKQKKVRVRKTVQKVTKKEATN